MEKSRAIQFVQDIYASFGRADIAAVLSALSDDVDWQVFGPPVIPYAGMRHGREQVAEFFTALGTCLDIQQFEPREFVADGDTVVVFGYERGEARATKRPYEANWVHMFTLRQGKVSQFREYIDTAAVASALK